MNSTEENSKSLDSTILSEYSAESGSASEESGTANTGEWMKRTYRKLHRIAVSQMSHENSDHTLSATSLIHEVFLRLQTREASAWLNERQFLGIVASEMKRVLIDAARRKKSLKRGGGHSRLMIDEKTIPQTIAESVVELNEAIVEFEKIEPGKAELVRLRYFLGLTEVEAAQTMGISRATSSRYWTFARAWLLDFLSK